MPLRYVMGFAWPVIWGVRRFLAAERVRPEDLEAIQAAWGKAVLLHITLWSRAFTCEGWW